MKSLAATALFAISACSLVVFIVAIVHLVTSPDNPQQVSAIPSATSALPRQILPFRTSDPTRVPTPSPTLTITPQPVSDDPTLYAERIAACGGHPSGSTVTLNSTSRAFVDLPRHDYLLDQPHFVPVSGKAGGGWISNAGDFGNAIGATDACWKTYYELDGEGETDFVARSAREGVPDYVLRFVVQVNDGRTPTPR